MYSFWSVSQLRAELRRRNASLAGKKADLIERLEAYDRNDNFGADFHIDEDSAYQCPPSDTFRDINADSPLPNISRQDIQDYFERFNTRPKGQSLYECRHLVTARYSCDSKYTYVRGQCKASMKKVVYIVDVKLSEEGIEESHCECAAGSGIQASCKHVDVLLWGVHDIVNNNMIKLHQSCTQELMMFKKPKKVFFNSPIAAQDLPRKRQKTCNYNPIAEADIMDNYEDHVRNLVFGYGDTTMPILQTYEPANPHGIECDHALYTKESQQDRVLEALLLKNVSNTKINMVEEETRTQNDCPKWHKIRASRITSSLFYAICHNKTGEKKYLLERIMAPKPLNTRAVVHGRIHEAIAISKYEMDYELNVKKCGIFISHEYPFLAASPDGLLGEETIIEVKCPFSSRHCLIDENTVPYLERKNGELCLKANHPYYAQIQGQMYCTQRKYCNFIVYTFKDFKVLFVSRDDSYISEMITCLLNFYVHYLEPALLNKHMYKNYISLIKKQ